MTRIHRTRTRRPAAAAREESRIVAALEAAALARFLEAERLADAIDGAEWMADAQADALDGLAYGRAWAGLV